MARKKYIGAKWKNKKGGGVKAAVPGRLVPVPFKPNWGKNPDRMAHALWRSRQKKLAEPTYHQCDHVLTNGLQVADVWGFSAAGEGSLTPPNVASGQMVYSLIVDNLGDVFLRIGVNGNERVHGTETPFNIVVNGLPVSMEWNGTNNDYQGNNVSIHALLDDKPGELFCVTNDAVQSPPVFHAATLKSNVA